MENLLIESTIKALKKYLLGNDNVIEMYCGQGIFSKAKCSFNAPISDEEINLFEKSNDVILPNDYKNFLKQCNGCSLFEDLEYGGESYLSSLEEISEYHKVYMDIPKGWLIVGYFYEDLIIIDTNRSNSGDMNYLLVNDCSLPFNDAELLNSNFEIWFDRVIINQGEKFWTWKLYSADNYYQLCRGSD